MVAPLTPRRGMRAESRARMAVPLEAEARVVGVPVGAGLSAVAAGWADAPEWAGVEPVGVGRVAVEPVGVGPAGVEPAAVAWAEPRARAAPVERDESRERQ